MSEFSHEPVLLQEVIEGLSILPHGIYLDGTAGGAGHSAEIAKQLTTGKLIALDQDPVAVKVATERMKDLPAQVVEANFKDTQLILHSLNINGIDGALLDLGVSSHQLDEAERGFSYNKDAPLDMRMSGKGTTAADLVNTLTLEELTKIITEYGEEKYAYYIAKKIISEREKREITGTQQLAELITSSLPPAVRRKEKNPARKTFQALRIAVNNELGVLQEGIENIFETLNPGGRFCIITFHSLEDRLVKHTFRQWCTACTCPPQQPICTCGGVAKAKAITRKAIRAQAEELETNRRSRSASLRIIEKI